MNHFNWQQYLQNYPDLQAARIDSQEKAWAHYNLHGKNENRTDKNVGFPLELLRGTGSKITIITPCCRPENLQKVIKFMNFDYIDEWIIVYDSAKVINFEKQFTDNPKINEYFYKFDGTGLSGHPQRNYGLTQVQNKNTFIYFLDDDNIIHQELYKLLNVVSKGYFYTFNQVNRIPGNNINVGFIDTAMFLIDYNLIKNTQWVNDKYYADGIFISDIYNTHPDKWIYVNNMNCYYNFLN